MTVEFNLTNIIFVLIALVSGLWALVKVIAVGWQRLTQQQQAFFTQAFKAHEKSEFDFRNMLTKRLDAIEALHREDASQWQRLERELLMLKADLPLHYVRREDYVQAIATIMVKLDAASLRHENLILKGVSREH